MKKKSIFLLLLQSSIIFLLTADVAKVIFRYNAWLRLAIFAFVFSAFGAVFIESYEATKKKKTEKVVSIKKGKKKEQSDDFLLYFIAIEVVIAIVIVFIEGVLLERPCMLDTFVSMLSFFYGMVIYPNLPTNKMQK